MPILIAARHPFFSPWFDPDIYDKCKYKFAESKLTIEFQVRACHMALFPSYSDTSATVQTLPRFNLTLHMTIIHLAASTVVIVVMESTACTASWSSSQIACTKQDINI